jgi:uncharacterized repeat protein (TIGR01451 family)
MGRLIVDPFARRFTAALSSLTIQSANGRPAPSAGRGRSGIMCLLLALAAVFGLAGYPNSAGAQTSEVGLTKFLCVGAPAINSQNYQSSPNCTQSSNNTIVPNTQVSFLLVLANPQSANPITVTEQYPSNFVVGSGTPITCTVVADPFSAGPLSQVTLSQAGLSTQINQIDFTIGHGQTVVCQIVGFFNAPGSGLVNSATVTNSTGGSNTTPITFTVQPATQLPADLAVAKTASTTSLNLSTTGTFSDTITYTVTITHTGNPANPNSQSVYLGQLLEVHDLLAIPVTSVPLNATLVGSSVTCTVQDATLVNITATAGCPTATQVNNSPLNVSTGTWQGFIEWGYPAGQQGFLPPGGTITLTYQVKIAANNNGVACAQNGDGIANKVFLGFNALGAATTINDQGVSNNTATNPTIAVNTGAAVYDPALCMTPPPCPPGDCPPPPAFGPPKLVVLKEVAPLVPVNWGQTIKYQVTIKNISPSAVQNITFTDLITGGLGSPIFQVSVGSVSCAPACSTITINQPQTIQGWGSSATILQYLISQLQPGQDIVISFDVRFYDPSCDSNPNVQHKLVYNTARATYTDDLLDAKGNVVGTAPRTISAAVNTEMIVPPPQPCPVAVTKVASVSATPFGTQYQYDVTFTHSGPAPQTYGTLFDALRFVPNNYAGALNVSYNYACTAKNMSGGYPTTGPPPGGPGPGNVSVVFVQTPHRGVRLLENSAPVTFQPGGELKCKILVTVSPPPSDSRFCLSAQLPQMENVALMDVSPHQFYNTNTPWPPSGTYNPVLPLLAAQPPAATPENWATVVVALPRCFKLDVNKRSEPSWTWQNGGPLTYTLEVTNNGDDINLGPNDTPAPFLEDFFTPQYPPNAVLVSDPCVGVNQPCTWATMPPANPFRMRINKLAPGQTLTVKFTVTGPYQPPAVINPAKTYLDGPGADGWYAYNDASCATYTVPTTATAGTCTTATVPVLQVGSLQVLKSVVSTTGVPLAGMTFPVTVTCPPYIPTPPTGPVTLNLTANIPQTVPNIPVGTACTVTEAWETLPAPRGCTWGKTVYDPPSAVITSPTADTRPARIVVKNTLECRATALLKVCKVAGPGIDVGTPFTFTAGSSTFAVPAGPPPGGTCVLGPIFPVGSTVTVSETMQPGYTVSSIDVAPVGRMVTKPNLAGGSVNVTIGSGVTEVTFTDKRTGYLEICKKGELPGSFMVNPGGLGPFAVPAGACSPAIEVVAGPAVIHEVPAAGVGMTGCETIPPAQQGPCDLAAQTSTVTIAPGDVSTMTIAMIANGRVRERQTGSLYVQKTVISKEVKIKIPPGITFPVQVACAPNGPNQTINLTAATPSVTLPNIVAGSVCTITELPPVGTPPPGCRWGPLPAAQSATIPAQSQVERFLENRLICR